MLSNKPGNIADPITQTLETHETARIDGDFFDLREFDSGQVLVRIATSDASPQSRDESDAAVQVEIPTLNGLETVEFSRYYSGLSHMHDRGGSYGSMIEPKFIPKELEAAIALIEEIGLKNRREWPNPIETGLGVIVTAQGHGNMHPRMLLSAELWSSVIKAQIVGTPVKRFDFIGGLKRVEETGTLIPAEKLTKDYDGFVAKIAPFCYGTESLTRATCVEVTIFNPAKLHAAPVGDRNTPPAMHSAENSYIHLSRFYESDDPKTHLSFTTYSDDKARGDRGEFGDEVREGTFYIKIDPELINKLFKFSPLPVDRSACGAKLESKVTPPDKESNCYRDYDIVANEMREALQRGVELINTEDGWKLLESNKQARGLVENISDGALMRKVIKKDDSVEISIKSVPAELALEVRTITNLGGRKTSFSRLFGLGVSMDFGLAGEEVDYVYLEPEQVRELGKKS